MTFFSLLKKLKCIPLFELILVSELEKTRLIYKIVYSVYNSELVTTLVTRHFIFHSYSKKKNKRGEKKVCTTYALKSLCHLTLIGFSFANA